MTTAICDDEITTTYVVSMKVIYNGSMTVVYDVTTTSKYYVAMKKIYSVKVTPINKCYQ